MLISTPIKTLGWIVVALMNAFFVYFSILRGLERGLEWQKLFALACVIQLVVEVIFYETSECAVVHFFIPDLVRSQVQTAAFVLRRAVQSMCKNDDDDQEVVLDVPQYLFVSTALASRMPHLVESSIILSYHTHNPGELSRLWRPHFSVVNTVLGRQRHSTGAAKSFTLSAVFMSVCLFVGSQSITLQRMLIHAVQPIVAVALFVIVSLLAAHPLYILILAPVVAFGIYQMFQEYQRYKINKCDRIRNEKHDVWPLHPPTNGQVSKTREEGKGSFERERQTENLANLIPEKNSEISIRSPAVAPLEPKLQMSPVAAGRVDVAPSGSSRRPRGWSISSDDIEVYYGRETPGPSNRQRLRSDSASRYCRNDLSDDTSTQYSQHRGKDRPQEEHDYTDSVSYCKNSVPRKARCWSVSSDDMYVDYARKGSTLWVSRQPQCGIDTNPGLRMEDMDGCDSDGEWRDEFLDEVDAWVNAIPGEWEHDSKDDYSSGSSVSFPDGDDTAFRKNESSDSDSDSRL